MSRSLRSAIRGGRKVLAAIVFVIGIYEIPTFVSEHLPYLYTLSGETLVSVLAVVFSFFLALLIIGPINVLRLVRSAYNWYEGYPESVREQELAAQERRRAQDTLDRYLDQMRQLILDKDRPLRRSQWGDEVRESAQELTLAVLERLGSDEKRRVLEFLYRQKLIKRDGPIVRLIGRADLSSANLTGMTLFHIDLDGANLSGADLSGAKLSGASISSAAVDEGLRRGVSARNFDVPLYTSTLSGANLSSAILKGTRLAGCYLVGANLDGADLEETDLRGANLQLARNLTQEQIQQAYGSYQLKLVPDTKLPKHLEVPAAWSKPIDEQK